jgi:LPXTG-motif cell wall-anchored protein
VELGSFVADSSGVVTASVAIPATVEAGSHRFMLTGEQSGDRVVHFRLAAARTTATAAAAGAEGDTSIALPLVGAGAALVLLGGGGALVVRRRRAAAIG